MYSITHCMVFVFTFSDQSIPKKIWPREIKFMGQATLAHDMVYFETMECLVAIA
jgi:hypothetical protein